MIGRALQRAQGSRRSPLLRARRRLVALAERRIRRARASGRVRRVWHLVPRPLRHVFWWARFRLALRKADPRVALARILEEHASRQPRLLLCYGVEWNIHLFQRPQQLALALARRGALVFYLEPEHAHTSVGVSRIADGLYRCRLPARLLQVSAPVPIAQAWSLQQLRRWPREEIVYDWIDELGVFPGDARRLRNDHSRLLNESRLVLTSAQRLAEQAAALRPDRLLCPNGVDYAHFAAADVPGPLPPDLEAIVARRRPVVGYYGALARWFDYDLLGTVARARPDLSFVLIGPDYDGTLPASGVARLGNVSWLGPRSYATLPRYLSHFDVTMIPFIVNDVTRSTSPLKLFEYMAAQKPVVTTELDECRRYEPVLIARGAAEFAAQLEVALGLRRDADHRRLLARTAAANSWDFRAEMILNALVASRGQAAPASPPRL